MVPTTESVHGMTLVLAGSDGSEDAVIFSDMLPEWSRSADVPTLVSADALQNGNGCPHSKPQLVGTQNVDPLSGWQVCVLVGQEPLVTVRPVEAIPFATTSSVDDPEVSKLRGTWKLVVTVVVLPTASTPMRLWL